MERRGHFCYSLILVLHSSGNYVREVFFVCFGKGADVCRHEGADGWVGGAGSLFEVSIYEA